jgi:hypothetical protein
MNLHTDSIQVVSYGGGTDSTAMLVGMVAKGIAPDHILFADTGAEKEGTYAYITYFSGWLVSKGFPPIEVVRYRTKHGEELTLLEDITNHQTLPAIAFGWKTCSQKFKIQPQDKFITQRYPDRKITHYIGFEFGEQRRIKENPNEGHANIYPLIDWGWNRAECKRQILEAGLDLPGKSSCFFCPNMKKGEILALSDTEKEKVKQIESNARNKVELAGLGRSFAWTDLLNADKSQYKLFEDSELYQLPCECIH